MRNVVHVVNVMRRAEARDSLGETPDNQDTLIRKSVPCSIETLSAREAEQARTVFPDANYKVEMYADPKAPVTPDCYLTGGSLGKAKLYCGPDLAELNGPIHTLPCSGDLSSNG